MLADTAVERTPDAPTRHDASEGISQIVTDEFGSEATQFVRRLASTEFDQFKHGMQAIGFPALSDCDATGLHGGDSLTRLGGIPKLACAALCLRYPFLAMANADPLDTTMLDALPMGWVARFGLEMCEDLLTALGEDGRLSEPAGDASGIPWRIDGMSEDIRAKADAVLAMYGEIAARTCHACGGMDGVRRMQSSNAPECFRCQKSHVAGLHHPGIRMRYNEMVDDGSLARAVARQSDAWHQATGVGNDGTTSFPVVRSWRSIQKDLETLVEKDLMASLSHHIDPIGDMADGLLDGYDGVGERGRRMAASIDTIRHDCDGDE